MHQHHAGQTPLICESFLATMSHERSINPKTSQITVTLRLTNWVDTVLAERGLISAAEVRTCTVENALAQRAVTRLCLPANVIQKLGLTQTATIDAQTATGLQTLRVFKGLKLAVEDREGHYDCVELPTGQTPLLGRIPLEDLGLEPDLQNQSLRCLPNRGKETYLTVL
jgi:hypothetical protein